MKKTIVAVFMLGLCLAYQPKVLVADMFVPPTVDEYIQNIFGKEAKVAKAVLLHESNGLKLNAINYNCIYGGQSKSCKKKDKSKAWSVDCGVGQINVKGKYCPKTLFTLEGNMKEVARIYKSQGLNAWSSYKNGKYKKYL